MTKFKLTWAPEGKTIAIVEATDAKAAKKMTPLPYRKYLGEVGVCRVGYRGAIWAKEGKLLLGGVKSTCSTWFDTRKEAEDWLYAMQQANIGSTEVEERC